MALIGAPSAFAQEGAPADAPAATLEWKSGPGEVIVAFEDVPGELAEAAGGPRLEVYGDGLVVVTRPPYMRDPGRIEHRLEARALQTLLRRLQRHGVMDFDPASAREARRASRRRRRERLAAAQQSGAPTELLQASSDRTLSRFEVRLRRYRRAGDAQAPRALEKRIEWRGLRSDARIHADVPALVQLEQARRLLRQTMVDARRASRGSGGTP